MNRALFWTAMVFLIVGGFNWGLIGLFEYNLISRLFGPVAWLERLVYTLIGVAAGIMTYYAIKSETPMRTHRHEGRRV